MTIDYGTMARIRRKELGLSQQAVADAACVNRDTIVAFETNRRSIGLDIFIDILGALGLKLVVEEMENDGKGVS